MATYRIQLHADFRLADVREIVDYLQELGITILYTSPLLRAMPGSTHGYDVVDPLMINPEIGSEEELRSLSADLRSRGMGLMMDIVPNHMAARSENGWWMDVLRNGSSSPFAGFFDVNWESGTGAMEHRILLPVLGRPYGDVLEDGEIRLAIENGGFFIRYWERKLPLNLEAYGEILRDSVRELHEASPGSNGEGPLDALLQRVETELASPSGEAPSRRDLRAIHATIEALRQEHPEVAGALDAVVERLNGHKSDPRSFDPLDRILENQAYRLAFWKMAAEEINYRRFFDISDLISVRVGDSRVFETTHAKILELVRDGVVTALRIDHIDGLYDPAGYLRRLRDATRQHSARPGRRSNPLIVMEKILGEDEEVPGEFVVRGTTGYEFLAHLEKLFVEPSGFEALRAGFARLTGIEDSFEEIGRRSRIQVIWDLFAGEIRSFGTRLTRLASRDRRARDVPMSELRGALIEVMALMPVYRTYIRDRRVSPRDRRLLERVIDRARSGHSEETPGKTAFDFLREVLLLEQPAHGPRRITPRLEFVRRWQQLTSPVTAKGIEDTALYIFNPLLSLNEVGCEPVLRRPARESFLQHIERVATRSPDTLNATSTHDTKRSEDVRARLNVLSEIPGEWEAHLRKWMSLNQSFRTSVGEHFAPDANEEIFLYQSLLGAWPLDPGELPELKPRIQAAMTKSMREAKVNTRWTRIEQRWETAVMEFVDAILDPDRSPEFLESLQTFQRKIAFHGALNSLGQVLLKVASPGIPDFYQGNELWDFSLVDPDNRRAVDFDRRRSLLEKLMDEEENPSSAVLINDLLRHWEDGRIKLWLTWKLLQARRTDPELFHQGEVVPLENSGEHSGNVIAFLRRLKNRWALIVAPRWTTQLTSPGQFPVGPATWRATAIRFREEAPHQWTNVLTGAVIEPSDRATEGRRSPRQLSGRAPAGRRPAANGLRGTTANDRRKRVRAQREKRPLSPPRTIPRQRIRRSGDRAGVRGSAKCKAPQWQSRKQSRTASLFAAPLPATLLHILAIHRPRPEGAPERIQDVPSPRYGHRCRKHREAAATGREPEGGIPRWIASKCRPFQGLPKLPQASGG